MLHDHISGVSGGVKMSGGEHKRGEMEGKVIKESRTKHSFRICLCHPEKDLANKLKGKNSFYFNPFHMATSLNYSGIGVHYKN